MKNAFWVSFGLLHRVSPEPRLMIIFQTESWIPLEPGTPEDIQRKSKAGKIARLRFTDGSALQLQVSLPQGVCPIHLHGH